MLGKKLSTMRASSRASVPMLLVAALSAGLLSSSDANADPAVFPPPNPWIIALNGGVPLSDVEGDTQGARDIVGDAARPLLFVTSDATHLYFRLRVDENPIQGNGGFEPFGWGCLMNTNSDLTTYEFSVIIDGVGNQDHIYFYKNTSTTTFNSPLEDPDIPALDTTTDPLDPVVGHATVSQAEPTSDFGGTPDFYIDWVIDLQTALNNGFDPSQPVNYYCGSANNGTTLSADCSGGTASGCPLDTEFTDPIKCDSTGCGVCGDNNQQGPEGCDDGNTVGGDGCSATCQVEAGGPCTQDADCESNSCDLTNNVCACGQDADCPAGQVCDTASSPSVCVMPGCGNNVIEPGEACDDGNLTNGDGCDSACLLEIGQSCTANSVCGSDFCDLANNTCACDQDSDCPMGDLCDTVSNPNSCVMPGCGNNIIEPGEACDDGNLSDGDGCSSACLTEIGQLCTANSDCASDFCDPSGGICGCDQDSDCQGSQSCDLMSHVCVGVTCGNGTVEGSEACDDGNIMNGDGCNSLCLIELGQPCAADNECASASCDPAMNVCACDQNVDCPAGQLCDTLPDPNQCVLPGCGNGVLELNEGCDDGNMVEGDGCNSACLKELGQPCTGNNVCASDLCDATNNTCACGADTDCPMGQLCAVVVSPNACVDPGCGNFVLEAGEACDDGNTAGGDGCDSACLKEAGQPCVTGAECASDFCDPSASKCACDEDTDCPAGQICNTNMAPSACVNAGCGNFVVEAGEGCDDGNLLNGDGCNSSCLKELAQPCSASTECASTFCNPAGNICACDEDVDCPMGQLCDPALNVCYAMGCGNGVVEATEGCDDGNILSGDGCNSSCLKELNEPCTLNSECASAFCDPAGNVCACDQNADCPMGQLCVPGQPNQCAGAGCGNSLLEASEGCDDGNLVDGDGCNSSCLKELGQLCAANNVCASAFCDPTGNICVCDQDADCPLGLICDTASNPNACVSGCGNGVVDLGEGCDDGNLMDGDGCNANCKKELDEGCNINEECASNSCNLVAGLCECLSDSDCIAPQLCNISGDPNVCVNSICGNSSIEGAEECDDQNVVSGDGCSDVCMIETDWACTGEPSDCTPKPCSSDADCKYCNEQYSICVQPCSLEVDCPSGFFCDLVSGICAPPCADGSECPSGICAFGECAECASSADCEGGETCQNGVCGAGCASDSDCATGLVCDTVFDICVECLTDAECSGGLVCVDNHCLPGCNEEADCNGVICNETIGVCMECTTDADCGSQGACDLAYGQCVPLECAVNADCPNGFCNLETHTCGCTTDAECGDGYECNPDTGACDEEIEPSWAGGGVSCALSQGTPPVEGGGSGTDKLHLTMLGLLGLAFLGRRRRRNK